ncbi:DedA family protein [Dyella sp. 2RAB6]|uniref:DedA family protein n=1 Tax=Dyella sp. 2RAB6 TaxID=3232992 RepID=UPI003F8F0F1F
MEHWLAWLLHGGFTGICMAAFAEKLVPVFPSYVLYMGIGMHMSDAAQLVAALLASSLGSTLASACWYALGRALGQHRTEALVVRAGRRAGLDAARYAMLVARCRRRPFVLVLLGQVIPVVRLCVPLIAGVLEVRPRSFLTATALGNALWNGTFLGMGFALQRHVSDPAQAGIAVVLVLLMLEALLAAMWRRRQRLGEVG